MVKKQKVKQVLKFKGSLSLILLILLFLSGGCSQGERFYRRTFISLGTFVEVTSPYKEATSLVFSTFKELENIFNIYDKNSQLSKVNRNAGIRAVKIGEELIEVIKLAKDLYRITEGVFDPSIGKAILFWKEKISKKDVSEVSSQKIEELNKLKGLNYVKINEEEGTVFIEKEGIVLDLGGLAKGYIIDKAVEALRKNNIDSALINAGGDIYCLGRRFNKPWRIGIRNPKALSEIIDTLEIENEAIATSGDYEQFFEYKGRKISHIIDPRNCLPVEGNLRSVTVVAHNATTADGLATAFFVMGKDGVLKFLEKNPSNIKIFLIEEEKDKLHIHYLVPLFKGGI